MNNTEAQWLFVTDLDGTLLNHHDYSLDAALPALQESKRLQIPVIPNTSKTYRELVSIRQQLDLDTAFVVENGSCIYIPSATLDVTDTTRSRDGFTEIVCGKTRAEISAVLESISLPGDACVRLSQCTVAEAVALTGLRADQAEQAIDREYSEPLIWQANSSLLQEFISELEKHGLSTLQGGRFLHVIGQCDKGAAVRKLAEIYGTDVKTAAFGDSPNDAAMLQAADVAVIIRSPSSEALSAMVEADYTSKAEAPAGWAEAVFHVTRTYIQA